MDPVTHGLIGATTSQSVASNKTLYSAAFTGFIAAMLADLDILIDDPHNPLLNIEFHRQFTHSLIFIPVGAFIASCLLWWFLRRYLSFRQIYGYSFLGYATSGITDTFTSYGTILLWPFSYDRLSWNIISVFDPVFTLGIIITLGYGLYRKNRAIASFAFLWIGLYIIFGILQQQRARKAAHQLAKDKNHQVEQLIVKPSIANQILWSVRYTTGDSLYAAGVHLSPFSGKIIYDGESTKLINWQQEFSRYEGTTLYKDLERFARLSEGLLTRHPQYDHIIGDGRYAMVPTSTIPLWGVHVDTTAPGQHLPFKNFRDTRPEIRDSFFNMLLGNKQ